MSMMFTVVGRLTRDPEIEVRGNYQLAKITVAASRNYKNSQGEYDSDFHNLEIWGKRAEHIQKYLSKGSLVQCIGDTENNNYEKDGKKVYGTVHKVKDIKFLADYGHKDNGQNSPQNQQAPYGNQQQGYGQQNAYQNPQQGQYPQNQGQQPSQQPYSNQGQQFNNQGQQAPYNNHPQNQYPPNQVGNPYQGQGQPLDISDDDLPF